MMNLRWIYEVKMIKKKFSKLENRKFLVNCNVLGKLLYFHKLINHTKKFLIEI